jgi:hypothetical protein
MMSGTNLGLSNIGLHSQTLEGRETGFEVSGVNESGEAQTWNIAPENVQQYWGRYGQITDNFIYDASYGKLRELSIGFNIPAKFLSQTPITNLKLSAVGRNLAILWSNVPNIDPESGYTAAGNSQGLEYFSMPSVRNLGFNLSANF